MDRAGHPDNLFHTVQDFLCIQRHVAAETPPEAYLLKMLAILLFFGGILLAAIILALGLSLISFPKQLVTLPIPIRPCAIEEVTALFQ